jgi:hypothetical protein
MGEHRKSDRRRDDPGADGLRKTCIGGSLVADNLSKADGIAAVSQARIHEGNDFGLPPQSARTPGALLCMPMKS